MTTIRNKYVGITHDKIPKMESFNDSWKMLNCSKGCHLFDEVWSIDDHYLYCDVCGMEVHIKEIVIPDGKDEIVE